MQTGTGTVGMGSSFPQRLAAGVASYGNAGIGSGVLAGDCHRHRPLLNVTPGVSTRNQCAPRGP